MLVHLDLVANMPFAFSVSYHYVKCWYLWNTAHGYERYSGKISKENKIDRKKSEA